MMPCSLRQVRRNPSVVNRLAGAGATEPPSESAPGVPAWVAECARPHFHYVSAGFDAACAMDVVLFQRRVEETYATVFEELKSTGCSFPVRFWVFVPGIHDELDAGLDRYMAFNAGRYSAFASHFASSTSFCRQVATASAVGITDDRFSLHCLAADEPGLPVENPRQVSSYHYSRRFGPLPPCFARATLLHGDTHQPMLLVGGTASIIGEESRHVGALESQARETVRNLAGIVAAARGRTLPEDVGRVEIKSLLSAFRQSRVYYTTPAHQDALASIVMQTAFSSECQVEWLQAALCRSELLVEMEGVAFL